MKRKSSVILFIVILFAVIGMFLLVIGLVDAGFGDWFKNLFNIGEDSDLQGELYSGGGGEGNDPWLTCMIADVNSDGVVNLLDQGIVGDNWRQLCLEGKICGDLNNDDFVDLIDLGMVGDCWNKEVCVSNCDNIFTIYTCQELQEIAQKENLDKNYILMNDIDCSGINFIPIGDGVYDPNTGDLNTFTGTFDGNGFVIYNLKIDMPESNNPIGLFGINKGIIRNLGLENVYMSGKYYVGAVAGKNNNRIENCYSTGSVNGYSFVGGLVGESGVGNYFKVYSTAEVSGTNYVGGLIGRSINGIIKDCYYAGSKVNGNNFVSGITNQDSISSIKNCIALSQEIYGNDNVAGLIFLQSSSPEIIDSYYDDSVNCIDCQDSERAKTTSELQDFSWLGYNNWDFEKIWTMNNGEYPKLRQESYSYWWSSDSIDDKITDVTYENAPIKKEMFSERNHDTGVFIRNPDCWAKDLDLSPISVDNSQGYLGVYTRLPATLISPRHVILAHHASAPIGTVYKFVDMDNNIIERTLVNSAEVMSTNPERGTDLEIGILDSDVPAGFGFMKVLPDGWEDKLALETFPPVISFNQKQRATIWEKGPLYPVQSGSISSLSIIVPPNINVQRYILNELVMGGDSGYPVCFVIDNQLVMLTCLQRYPTAGICMGANMADYKNEINNLMASLQGGENPYQLTEVDLGTDSDSIIEGSGSIAEGSSNDDYSAIAGTSSYSGGSSSDSGGNLKSNCSNGTCIESDAVSDCIDTEDEIDYYVKGIVTKNFLEYADICINSVKLQEYYCEDNDSKISVYECPYGCVDGACSDIYGLKTSDNKSKNGEGFFDWLKRFFKRLLGI